MHKVFILLITLAVGCRHVEIKAKEKENSESQKKPATENKNNDPRSNKDITPKNSNDDSIKYELLDHKLIKHFDAKRTVIKSLEQWQKYSDAKPPVGFNEYMIILIIEDLPNPSWSMAVGKVEKNWEKITVHLLKTHDCSDIVAQVIHQEVVLIKIYTSLLPVRYKEQEDRRKCIS